MFKQLLVAPLTRSITGLGEPQRRALFLGLDAAGKTTVIYKLDLPTPPTYAVCCIGMNIEEFEIGNLKVETW